MPDAEAPLAPAEADRLLERLAGARGLALAVSGGPDSTALMRLAADWAARRAASPPIVVLTVDHGLRAASRAEAEAVAAAAAGLGLPHEILTWTGPKPSADIQAAARAARYALLAAAARRHGADRLVTAHTRDDQAETFLLALARGSGIYGLAAMPAERPLAAGLTLVRPFLDIPKARLVATLSAAGVGFVEDPSNADPRFRRVAWRRAMADLAALGLDRDRLAETAARMARAAAAVDAVVDRLFAAAASLHAAGFARIDAARLAAEPDEMRLRALARLLRHAGAAAHPPRAERLERLARDLAAGAGPDRRTLAGVTVERRGADLWFLREAGRADLAPIRLDPGAAGVFDRRWLASLAADAPGPVEVGPLGRAEARRLVAGRQGLPPPFALATAPAVRFRDHVALLPGLDIAAPPLSADAVRLERIGG